MKVAAALSDEQYWRTNDNFPTQAEVSGPTHIDIHRSLMDIATRIGTFASETTVQAPHVTINATTTIPEPKMSLFCGPAPVPIPVCGSSRQPR